jgi:hypothetical protein
MQSTVSLGANNPYDRVIGTIGRCDPRRALAALTCVPSGDDGWRICRSNLVGLNLRASSAKNKICSLGGRVGGRRLASDYTINVELDHRRGDSPKVVAVNQIGITILACCEN